MLAYAAAIVLCGLLMWGIWELGEYIYLTVPLSGTFPASR